MIIFNWLYLRFPEQTVRYSTNPIPIQYFNSLINVQLGYYVIRNNNQHETVQEMLNHLHFYSNYLQKCRKT